MEVKSLEGKPVEVDWQAFQLSAYALDSQRILKNSRNGFIPRHIVLHGLELARTYLEIPAANRAQPSVDEAMVRLLWNLHYDSIRYGLWTDVCFLWERARPIARQLSNPAHFAEITRQLAITYNNRGESQAAQLLYEELIRGEFFAQLAANQQADILHQAGVCYRTLGKHQQAQQMLQWCIEVVDTQAALGKPLRENNRYALGTPTTNENAAAQLWEAKAYSLNQLGLMALNSGQFERAHHFYARCLQLFIVHGEEENLACVAYQGLGQLFTEQGKYAEAVFYLEKNRHIRQQRGEIGGVVEASILLAAAHVGSQQVVMAEALLEEAFAASRSLQNPTNIAHCHLLYGQIEQAQGCIEAALTQWHQGLAALNGPLSPNLQCKLATELLLVHLRRGNFAEAEKMQIKLVNRISIIRPFPHGATPLIKLVQK